MRNKFVLVVLAALIVLVNACRHEIIYPGGGNGSGGGGGTPPPVSNCSPDSIYFVNQVMPLISSGCTMSGCHDDITHADGVRLTTYSNIMKYVKPGNPRDSKLYTEIIKTGNDRMPPPPMAAFTTAQKALIEKWINQGAKNNHCTGNCDTAVFTYSGAVKLIMDNKCTGCHNPANLGGNVDVSTYNAVKVVALNGSLYGSVAHQSGFSPMPRNSAKLSDCEIRQIQKWIEAGTLNN